MLEKKMSTDLESLEFLRYFDMRFIKFKDKNIT